MRLTFSRPRRPHTIYVQKSFRDKDGKSTSRKVERLGTEEEIEEKYGVADGLEWAKAYVARLNEEERLGKERVKAEFSPTERIEKGVQVSYDCGDLVLLPLYGGLGLPKVCEGIVSGTKARYDLNGILETLVMLRILCPCSKLSSFGLGKKRLRRMTARPELIIVTYSHDFALYLRHKRQQRLPQAEKIVRNRQTKSRQSQNDPRRYVETTYITADGEPAEYVSMAVNQDIIDQEEKLDGFYAYGTSLDDDAVDVLRARSFNHEIEHLFRTTKSFLDSRPVYLQRSDRIRAHFLICFLAMVIIKMLQKQLAMPGLSIDTMIETIRGLRLGYIRGAGYIPLFERDELTDRLQEITGICIDTQIIKTKTLNAMYRKVLKQC